MKKGIFIAAIGGLIIHASMICAASYSPIISIVPLNTAPMALGAGGSALVTFKVTNTVPDTVKNIGISPDFPGLVSGYLTENNCVSDLNSGQTCLFTELLQGKNNVKGSASLIPRACIASGLDCSIPTTPNRITLSVVKSTKLQCWGSNTTGQLGNNASDTYPLSFKAVYYPANMQTIGAGRYETCVITQTGTMECAGANYYGQLGNGTTSDLATYNPVAVSGLSNVTNMSVSLNPFACAVSNGGVKCWGYNFYGQLGDGTTTNRSAPVQVVGLSSGITAVASGGNHACALLSDQTVKCWGFNAYGQLGNGTTTNSLIPVSVSGLSNVVAISAGISQTCALLTGGSVKCWGRNNWGQLGNNSFTDSSVPVSVQNSGTVSAISSSSYFNCELMTDNTAKCWGYGASGQLGNGTSTYAPTPSAVTGLSSVVAITTGESHVCALRNNQTIQCWGDNGSGQVGDGTTTDKLTATPVSGLSGAVNISAGVSHSCALLASGELYCWGLNLYGEMLAATNQKSTPIDTHGVNNAGNLNNVVQTAVGSGFSCALLGNQTVACWGSNGVGQLGQGTVINNSTPALVSGLTGVQSISTGYSHACALIMGGTVKCWGVNSVGELGNGTTTNSSTPVSVTGLSGVIAIVAGGEHTCALLSDGTEKCWGDNEVGELGDGTTTNRLTPEAVQGLTGVLSITAGGYHSCALLDSNAVRCWGYNRYGSVGDNTTVDRLVPTVVNLSDIIAISAGSYHTCALHSSGTLSCWGENDNGQLGNGQQITYGSGRVPSVPTAVIELEGPVKAIQTASDNTCALLASGQMQCWGNGFLGQLGDGSFSTNDRLTPVTVLNMPAALAIPVHNMGQNNCAVVAG